MLLMLLMLMLLMLMLLRLEVLLLARLQVHRGQRESSLSVVEPFVHGICERAACAITQSEMNRRTTGDKSINGHATKH
jgi:hypothetical protein